VWADRFIGGAQLKLALGLAAAWATSACDSRPSARCARRGSNRVQCESSARKDRVIFSPCIGHRVLPEWVGELAGFSTLYVYESEMTYVSRPSRRGVGTVRPPRRCMATGSHVHGTCLTWEIDWVGCLHRHRRGRSCHRTVNSAGVQMAKRPTSPKRFQSRYVD
jgi:hypothetical protein